MLPKISHPTYDVIVPTTKHKTKIRPMTVKEEKLLLMAKESGQLTDMISAMQQVVNNCLLLQDFDISKSPLIDLEYLFLKIRAHSISNVSTVTYKDNEDLKPYTFDIDLDKVEVKYPPSVPNIVQINDNLSFALKYPTSSFHTKIAHVNVEDANNFNELLLNCIDKIYEGTKIHEDLSNLEELQQFIDSIPAKNYEQIKKYFTSLPHLYYEVKYKNSKDHDRKIILETLEDFF